jgi:hypothetical protein
MVSAASSPTLAPSCFGFQVDSTIPLRFTRHGGGVEPMRVVEHSSVPTAHPAEPVFQVMTEGQRKAALWETGPGYEFLVDGLGCYRIDPVRRLIEVPAEAEPARREQVMWGVPATLCFIQRGDLSIHAASVEIDGGAVLIAAPGQHGKTTLAVAFHQAGHRVLSEDSSCCRLDQQVTVAPGPGLVRVRGASATLPDGLELEATRAGRAELAIAAERRGSGASVPLRGIVFLRESAGDPALTSCRPADALRDLWALHFGLPGHAARARSFEQVADLAHGVPSWDLSRRLDTGLLDMTVQLIVEELG